jgi:hypothetical protein
MYVVNVTCRRIAKCSKEFYGTTKFTIAYAHWNTINGMQRMFLNLPKQGKRTKHIHEVVACT